LAGALERCRTPQRPTANDQGAPCSPRTPAPALPSVQRKHVHGGAQSRPDPKSGYQDSCRGRDFGPQGAETTQLTNFPKTGNFLLSGSLRFSETTPTWF